MRQNVVKRQRRTDFSVMDVTTTDFETNKDLSGNSEYSIVGDPFVSANEDFINKGYMHERAALLTEKCKDYVKATGITPTTTRNTFQVLRDYIGKYKLKAIRYDPRYSAFYCLQHKAGSTHFNMVLAQIKDSVTPQIIRHGKSKFAIPHAPYWLTAAENGDTVQFAKEHEYIENWTVNQLAKGFKPLTHSVLLVRHPLSRLHSSWGHRFKIPPGSVEGQILPRQNYIDRMNTELSRPGDGPIPPKYSVTLPSFLRLMLALDGKRDFHWESVVETCRPCDYDGYEIIIHTNTADKDCKELGKFYGKEDVVEMHERYSQSLSVNTTSFDAEAYLKGQQKYWRVTVPRELTMAIYNGPYHWDFVLFGFTVDEYLGDF